MNQAEIKSSCCGGSTDVISTVPKESHTAAGSACCAPESSVRRFDWLLWSCVALVAIFYGIHLLLPMQGPVALQIMSHSIFELLNTMWWSVLFAAVFVGLLGQIPQDFVTATLGRGGSMSGLFRATAAGVLMDLCSHGILMVGMKLYQKGASLGQVMAFLIASPWNSISLTIIMVALIGLSWTLVFIALSMVLAISTGWMFECLVKAGKLPTNSAEQSFDEDFQFFPEAKRRWANLSIDRVLLKSVLDEAISGSRMVVRWLLFGVILASLIRAFVSIENFQEWFGPGLLGLLATLLAATIIEVCSEGSTPIAADLMTRANAHGNSFAFLMTGVATDYTEVMVIRDTMSSWKIALFLPLLTVPQVLVVALILNQMQV